MRKFDFYMLSFLRFILWPFSIIYGFIICFRNFLYDRGIFKSTKFSFPVVVVGNLAVGGTGKSPMTELLVRMLKDNYKLAILSRGYGRKTSGFLYVSPSDSAQKVGDEPLQFKNKFPEVTVAVCEDRVLGVEKLQKEHQLVILDDAYQHRALRPGFSILLVEYKSLFQPKFLLPTGDFRDTFSQKKRADAIVISKCPISLNENEKIRALSRLDAKPNQSVFFSFLAYDHPHSVFTADSAEIPITAEDDILLVTGIANPKPLLQHLEGKSRSLKLLQYPDHHPFSEKDIRTILEEYRSIASQQKYILTTEKDYQRFKEFSQHFMDIPAREIRVIRTETDFYDNGKETLSSLLYQYCEENLR